MPGGFLSVRGYVGVKTAINLLEKNFKNELEMAMRKCVLIVEAEARSLISRGDLKAVDTGILKGSLHGEIVEMTSRFIRGEVGTNVYYGIYVHEGTPGRKAKRFLFQALKNKQKVIEKTIRDAMRRAMRIGGK